MSELEPTEYARAYNPYGQMIVNLATPIITGIGLEIDVSFADLAADYQASSPTDAAIHAGPDKDDLLGLLSSYRSIGNLRQGYALVIAANGELVRSAASVHSHDVLTVQVANGSFAVTVNER